MVIILKYTLLKAVYPLTLYGNAHASIKKSAMNKPMCTGNRMLTAYFCSCSLSSYFGIILF